MLSGKVNIQDLFDVKKKVTKQSNIKRKDISQESKFCWLTYEKMLNFTRN